jgi:hypothetical protein
VASDDERPEAVEMLTPDQLAKRLQVGRNTIYKYLAQLGPEDGVVRFGKSLRIDWVVFRDGLLTGKIRFDKPQHKPQ